MVEILETPYENYLKYKANPDLENDPDPYDRIMTEYEYYCGLWWKCKIFDCPYDVSWL